LCNLRSECNAFCRWPAADPMDGQFRLTPPRDPRNSGPSDQAGSQRTGARNDACRGISSPFAWQLGTNDGEEEGGRGTSNWVPAKLAFAQRVAGSGQRGGPGGWLCQSGQPKGAAGLCKPGAERNCSPFACVESWYWTLRATCVTFRHLRLKHMADGRCCRIQLMEQHQLLQRGAIRR